MAFPRQHHNRKKTKVGGDFLELKEYKEIGKTLKQIYLQMLEHIVWEHPKRHPKNKFLTHAIDNMIKLRSNLEEVMFQEHPIEATTTIFFGLTSDE